MPAAIRRRTISVCWSDPTGRRAARGRGRGRAAPAPLPPATAVLGLTAEELSPRHRRRTTKASLLAGFCEGPKYDCTGHSSLTILQLLPQCAFSCRGRGREPASRGERGAGGVAAHSYSPSARPARAAARAHRARAPAAGQLERCSCSAATGCSSVSARAASGWSGAPTTSCCTARSRSSGSALGAATKTASAPSREALATARLAHPAIVALYEACAERATPST